MHMSLSTLDNVEFRRERLNIGLCSYDTPYGITGTTKDGIFFTNTVAMYSAIKESVETGRCDPCCSSDPTGTIARRVFLTKFRKPISLILLISISIKN